MNRNGFRITKNSGVNADAPSAKAFESFFLSMGFARLPLLSMASLGSVTDFLPCPFVRV